MDSVMRIADEAIRDGQVDANLLKNLRDQVTDERSSLLDEHLPIIQSLNKIAIDDEMVTRMSKYNSGRKLIESFYNELKERFRIEQQKLLDDIFNEVTEWLKQQK